VRHDLAERLHVRTVLADGMGALGQVSRAGPLQQHGVGVPLDPVRGQPGRRRDLRDGLTGADARLDLARPHLALDLDLDLAEPGEVAACRRAQPLVCGEHEALATIRVL
jgi:hypothetical protein